MFAMVSLQSYLSVLLLVGKDSVTRRYPRVSGLTDTSLMKGHSDVELLNLAKEYKSLIRNGGFIGIWLYIMIYASRQAHRNAINMEGRPWAYKEGKKDRRRRSRQ
ncbi:unnamed protein product [Prorocentrum cordatum]|uniref:Uncharacterized protein n=1 Tax=Prorocentrum cordatum TaxID=2364126 RepID=A0ABN9R0U5_9DINO|nr:unnamed protein product [Polarella glacialis]